MQNATQRDATTINGPCLAYQPMASVWLISYRPAVLFSQNKPATGNQTAVFFSQNKSAPATSNQPNE
jgi:hypothetical protein